MLGENVVLGSYGGEVGGLTLSGEGRFGSTDAGLDLDILIGGLDLKGDVIVGCGARGGGCRDDFGIFTVNLSISFRKCD
jgi:hypothetical protein